MAVQLSKRTAYAESRFGDIVRRVDNLLLDRYAVVMIVLFGISLILRVGVALWLPDEIVWSDGARYERVALNLLEGSGFGPLSDVDRAVPTQALLIAAVYAVVGQSYLALRIAFAVLGAASCILGGLLAAKLFGRTAGVFTALFLAGYPYLVYLSALFEYPQAFFIFAMAAFFLLYFRFTESGSYWMLFAAVLFLGLAVLSVPTVLIFAALFGLLLPTKSWRKTLARFGVCALAASLTVGTWAVRNYAAYDSLVLVNVAGGRAFWLGNNETYWQHGKAGVVPPCGPGNETRTYCLQHLALGEQLDREGLHGAARVFEEDRRRWQLGLEFVRDDPKRFAVHTLRKLADFWRPIPDAVVEGGAHGGRWRDYVAAATYLPMLALAILGVVHTASRWRQLLPIYLYVAAFVAPYAIFYPTTRYRLPIDFILIVFAGASAARVWASLAGSDRPPRPIT